MEILSVAFNVTKAWALQSPTENSLRCYCNWLVNCAVDCQKLSVATTAPERISNLIVDCTAHPAVSEADLQCPPCGCNSCIKKTLLLEGTAILAVETTSLERITGYKLHCSPNSCKSCIEGSLLIKRELLFRQMQQHFQSESPIVICTAHPTVATAAKQIISGCWLNCSPGSCKSCMEGSFFLLRALLTWLLPQQHRRESLFVDYIAQLAVATAS